MNFWNIPPYPNVIIVILLLNGVIMGKEMHIIWIEKTILKDTQIVIASYVVPDVTLEKEIGLHMMNGLG